MNKEQSIKRQTCKGLFKNLLILTLIAIVFLNNMLSFQSSFPTDEMNSAVLYEVKDEPTSDVHNDKIEHFPEPKDKMKCLSFDNELDKLVNKTEQVFIGMPAKASGSSLGKFAMEYCMKNYTHLSNEFFGWYFNLEDKILEMISNNFQVPNILVSHLGSEHALLKLVQGANDDSLIIYVHRHESDRLLSAVDQVVEKICSNRLTDLEEFKGTATIEDGRCIIKESALYEMVKKQKQEIGNSVYRALTCDFFEQVEENKPKMIIMDYRQTNQLQIALAKHYCPKMLNDGLIPVHINKAGEKQKKWQMDIYVRLSNHVTRVEPLREWLKAKRNVLEWALRPKVGCQGKIRDMEEQLFACNDGIVHI